jgi:hypothetical protein
LDDLFLLLLLSGLLLLLVFVEVVLVEVALIKLLLGLGGLLDDALLLQVGKPLLLTHLLCVGHRLH